MRRNADGNDFSSNVVLGTGREKEEPEQAITRVADVSTINSWQEYFGSETDTSNAGKIWTDKTVVDGDITLQSIEGDNNSTTISRKETDNFLVGLVST